MEGRARTLVKYQRSFLLYLFYFFLSFFLLALLLYNTNLELTDHSLYLVLLGYFAIASIVQFLIVSYFRKKDLINRNLESEERYKKLIDHHPDGIVIHEKGFIVYANSVAMGYLGYDESEIIGRSLLDFTHPNGHERINKREKEIYSTTRDVMYDVSEYELISKTGTQHFVESKAIVCQFNNKRCVQLVLRDITERKKQEEHMRMSDRLAVVGQMAAGIAHEIRNPLTSIKGFMQMMGESSHNNPLHYQVVMSEIDRIHQVTNDLLFLAKPHTDHFLMCDLLKIIQDVTTLLQPEAHLNNIQCEIVHDNSKQLLFCDENALKQVFINLIKNAFEAMPNGGKLTISCTADHQRLRVSLSDSGVGISAAQLPNIGQPFYTLKEKGTGLGLMTSIKIIEKHRGTFQIESVEGKGTTVTIEFPLENRI